MREIINDSRYSIMNANPNQLKHIPGVNICHPILQTIASMWCIIFVIAVRSWHFFGLNIVAYSLLFTNLAIGKGTFETTSSKYDVKRRLWIR